MEGNKEMARTRTLAQLTSTMTAIREKDNTVGADLKKRVQNENLTKGLIQVHVPLVFESDEVKQRMTLGIQPDVNKNVALTVPDALKLATEYAAAALDVVRTNDQTNQTANADVVLPDGMTLLTNVPVSHLLWLTGYLGEWRKFIAVLPVLDPTKTWTPTQSDGNVYQAGMESRQSTVKKVVPLVLHQGTDKHAPQVQAIEDTVPTGHYQTTALSGAVHAARKRELLDRFDMVIAAVKDATARANQTPVMETKEGEALLSFLLA